MSSLLAAQLFRRHAAHMKHSGINDHTAIEAREVELAWSGDVDMFRFVGHLLAATERSAKSPREDDKQPEMTSTNV